MHWHILGAGAIGLLWAAKFQRAGVNTTLLLRNPAKLAVYSGAFSIMEGQQVSQIPVPAEALHNPQGKPISHLLITTKSYDALAAFNSVRDRLTDNARVLLLHNGMGPQQTIAAQNPQLQVWAGSTTDGAYLNSAFELIRAGHGQTRIGHLKAPDDQSLSQQLTSCEPALSHSDNIHATLWQKLAINCAINPLTAIYRCRNGELASHAEYRAHMQVICHEAEQVAAALNIPLFDQPLIDQACLVAEQTADNYSSMYQDVMHGRRSEIDTITGYLCQQAEQLDIEVAENQRLLTQIINLQA
ncbi:ketopantoate reductase family protein [Aliamphritea hakodatensis]|uniref:ketopantoate reductase family protein n=1 Tax=Aliamphritea hakodatensis TaxID=2895352 RepID=UPI0022FD3CAB|nr:2-dehydropantoate 2-reductase [Aliamphritea hakodatensis]